MDPRTFLAPIQCNLCNLLLYTLRDVSQHCAQHDVIDFICHHCLTHFDSKGAIIIIIIIVYYAEAAKTIQYNKAQSEYTRNYRNYRKV